MGGCDATRVCRRMVSVTSGSRSWLVSTPVDGGGWGEKGRKWKALSSAAASWMVRMPRTGGEGGLAGVEVEVEVEVEGGGGGGSMSCWMWCSS